MEHWLAFEWVLRYLSGTKECMLILGGKQLGLSIYSDLDYASCLVTRKSTSRITTMLGNGCVAWRSRKQETVALSSMKAEYRAAYEEGTQVVWMRELLKSFGREQQGPTELNVDNEGTIFLTKNAVFQSRSKHFDVKHHWIRELVDQKVVRVEHIP